MINTDDEYIKSLDELANGIYVVPCDKMMNIKKMREYCKNVQCRYRQTADFNNWILFVLCEEQKYPVP